MNTLRYALLSSLIVLSGSLAASERPPESEIQKMMPLSKAERVQRKELWMKMNQEKPADFSKLCPANAKQYKTQDIVSSDTKVWYFYDEASHWVSNVGIFGDWVKFEDGSKWQIALSNQNEVAKWWVGDEIYVSQSDSVLYDYIVVNRTRAKHVYATRMTKPNYFGAYTRYIVAIDRFSDRILLNDGTWWNVSWFDDCIMQRWSENHSIIIGLNSGFDCLSYPFILINVGIDTYDLGLDEWVSAQLSY